MVVNGSETSTPFNVTTIPTGIIENNYATTINVYPNPTSGFFNLKMSQVEKVQIKIYNIFGVCIYEDIRTSSNFQIDLSAQLNGIYYVQLKSEQGTMNKKIIIQK